MPRDGRDSWLITKKEILDHIIFGKYYLTISSVHQLGVTPTIVQHYILLYSLTQTMTNDNDNSVHGNDVLEPEVARPGGLMRNDTVCYIYTLLFTRLQNYTETHFSSTD